MAFSNEQQMEGHLRIPGLGEFERSPAADIPLAGCEIKGGRRQNDVEVGHIRPHLHVQETSLLASVDFMIILRCVLKKIIGSVVSNRMEIMYSITN